MEIPDGYGLVTFRYTSLVDPDIMVNTLGVALSDTPSAEDLNSLAVAWEAALSAYVSTSIIWDVITCTVGPEPDPMIVEDATLQGEAFGDDEDNVLPTNTAMILRKNTAFGGRKNRGRVFVPGVLVEHTEANHLAPAAIAALNANLVTFVDSFPHGEIFAPVVLHTDALDTPTLITSMTAQSTLGVTRNRYRN